MMFDCRKAVQKLNEIDFYKYHLFIIAEQTLVKQQDQSPQQEMPTGKVMETLPEELSRRPSNDAKQTPLTNQPAQDDSATTSQAVTLDESKSMADEPIQEAETDETTQEETANTLAKSAPVEAEEKLTKDTPKVRRDQ